MEDPYLWDFFNDVGTVVNGFYYLVKTILGISYLCGKTIAQGIFDISSIIWTFFEDLSVVVKDLFYEILELEKSLIRGVFLVYYGAGKILEGEY